MKRIMGYWPLYDPVYTLCVLGWITLAVSVILACAGVISW